MDIYKKIFKKNKNGILLLLILRLAFLEFAFVFFFM